ncbi:MAG: hypothetical protein APF81_01965 [Desulfosporosinus sp. BRH_c37]|nr:MAG: hypothetical protein APF81_01965 [Desulfosporosinus sp. BRH_c37]
MKKVICSGLLTLGLVAGLATPTFASQSGLYVGASYYSITYLSTLSVTQRVTILTASNANPLASFAVVGSKYAVFKDYVNISSLKDGAEAVLPAQVNDINTGKLVDSKTGVAVDQGTETDPFEVTSIE